MLPEIIKNRGNNKVEIDPKIAELRYKFNINNFGHQKKWDFIKINRIKIPLLRRTLGKNQVIEMREIIKH